METYLVFKGQEKKILFFHKFFAESIKGEKKKKIKEKMTENTIFPVRTPVKFKKSSPGQVQPLK